MQWFFLQQLVRMDVFLLSQTQLKSSLLSFTMVCWYILVRLPFRCRLFQSRTSTPLQSVKNRENLRLMLISAFWSWYMNTIFSVKASDGTPQYFFSIILKSLIFQSLMLETPMYLEPPNQIFILTLSIDRLRMQQRISRQVVNELNWLQKKVLTPEMPSTWVWARQLVRKLTKILSVLGSISRIYLIFLVSEDISCFSLSLADSSGSTTFSIMSPRWPWRLLIVEQIVFQRSVFVKCDSLRKVSGREFPHFSIHLRREAVEESRWGLFGLRSLLMARRSPGLTPSQQWLRSFAPDQQLRWPKINTCAVSYQECRTPLRFQLSSNPFSSVNFNERTGPSTIF